MSALDLRLLLGRDAVLSETDAVRVLPFRDTVVRKWLKTHNLVRSEPELGDYVLMSDILRKLRHDPPVDQDDDPPPPIGATLRRAGVKPRRR